MNFNANLYRLKNKLTGTLQRWTGNHASLPNFHPFRRSTLSSHITEIDYLIRQFNPKKAAQHDAITGEPNLRSGNQASYEFGVRETLQVEMDRLQNETEHHIRTIDLRIKRLPPLMMVDDAAVMAMAEQRQESVLRSWYPPLVDSKRTELFAGRGLTAFRRANPPVQFRPVRPPNLLVVVPGILALCAAEMWLNYELLLGSGGHTPAEILTIVVLCSLFNLLFGLGVGFIGARNLGHIDRKHKVAGIAAIVFGCVLIIGLAFFMASYRNAIETALDDPGSVSSATTRLEHMAAAKAAMREKMMDDPLAFVGHIQAVLVFLLGIAFGAIAALEGYYLIDDPYPGYGAAARAYRRARDAHELAVKQFEKEFTTIIEPLIGPLDKAVRRSAERLTEIKTCLDAASRTVERYEKAATRVEYALVRIAIMYRDEYRIIRGNQGPAHWEEDIPRLNRETSFDLGNLLAIEERCRADYQAMEDMVFRLKSDLTQQQANMVSRIKEYLAAVDQDAAREEDLAYTAIFGVRTPPPPDNSYTAAGQGAARPFPPDHRAA